MKVTGIVESVSEGGAKDLVFKLNNDSLSYYINRGLENGFQLQKAKNDLIGKEIKIFYAKNWTPLAPLEQQINTSRIAQQMTVFYIQSGNSLKKILNIECSTWNFEF